MSLFEQTPRSNSRFGKLSSNMFFIRNTAKPKRVRHIEGLNGALICNVNDDPSVIRSTPSSSLDFTRTNIHTFENPRRVERVVPPMGFWNTFGVIHDTERWKQELASLATASGIGLEKNEQKYSNKPPPTTVDQQHASRSGAHYSTRTGRFNEGTTKSRGRTGSKHATAYSDMLFNVPENEREMWMLQVLCQLLGTSNLEEVQSWLVSASHTEKEQASTMINSALRGLKESERTANQAQESVDLNTLSNFVERQKNEEKYASQKYVKDTLNRSAPVLQSIDEEQQQPTDINMDNSWNDLETNPDYSHLSPKNATTYKRAYPNYNTQQSQISLDETSSTKKNNSSNENHQEDENEEQVDTIQLDDDRQRPKSASLTKTKKQSTKPQSPIGRPPSSHKQNHRIESIQFNDEGEDLNKTKSNVDENEDEHPKSKESSSSSNQTKPSSENSKSRKIRELQNKLSRQEEESKKKFDELQSKQSRLENAIKLLVKQTSSYGKRRQQTHDDVEKNPDTPVVNVIIQTPREADHREKQNEKNSSDQQSKPSTVQGSGKFQKNLNGNNGTKVGDYTIQDVKVQISLSRLDNRPAKIYSGTWKPDASTLHRLQGN